MEGSAVRGHPGSVEPTGLLTVLKELGGPARAGRLLTVLKELGEPARAGSLGAREDCTRDGLIGAVTAVASEGSLGRDLAGETRSGFWKAVGVSCVAVGTMVVDISECQ